MPSITSIQYTVLHNEWIYENQHYDAHRQALRNTIIVVLMFECGSLPMDEAMYCTAHIQIFTYYLMNLGSAFMYLYANGKLELPNNTGFHT